LVFLKLFILTLSCFGLVVVVDDVLALVLVLMGDVLALSWVLGVAFSLASLIMQTNVNLEAY